MPVEYSRGSDESSNNTTVVVEVVEIRLIFLIEHLHVDSIRFVNVSKRDTNAAPIASMLMLMVDVNDDLTIPEANSLVLSFSRSLAGFCIALASVPFQLCF